jgi:hypothetical protein
MQGHTTFDRSWRSRYERARRHFVGSRAPGSLWDRHSSTAALAGASPGSLQLRHTHKPTCCIAMKAYTAATLTTMAIAVVRAQGIGSMGGC